MTWKSEESIRTLNLARSCEESIIATEISNHILDLRISPLVIVCGEDNNRKRLVFCPRDEALRADQANTRRAAPCRPRDRRLI